MSLTVKVVAFNRCCAVSNFRSCAALRRVMASSAPADERYKAGSDEKRSSKLWPKPPDLYCSIAIVPKDFCRVATVWPWISALALIPLSVLVKAANFTFASCAPSAAAVASSSSWRILACTCAKVCAPEALTGAKTPAITAKAVTMRSQKDIGSRLTAPRPTSQPQQG